MTGFIKVYREQLDTVLLKNPAMMQVWIFLCEQARFRKTEKDGIDLLPGQLLMSAGNIARACGLKEDRARYILLCLEKQGLIRRQNIRNRYSLITVLEPSEPPEKGALQPPVSETGKCIPKQIKAQETANAGTPEAAEADVSASRNNAAKTAFGLFANVYLSAEEKRILSERTPVCDSYIDNLSAYKRRTKKEYDDDFSVLCEWISKDDINEKRAEARQAAQQLRREKEQTAGQKTTAEPCRENHFMPYPASYDLELAEKKALTVPKLKKRRRPNGSPTGTSEE